MLPRQLMRHFYGGITCVLFTWGNSCTSCSVSHTTYGVCWRDLPLNIQDIYPPVYTYSIRTVSINENKYGLFRLYIQSSEFVPGLFNFIAESIVYIYIYIYILSSTDRLFRCIFSVARHVGRFKLGSKPAQLYVRLSIRPLGQQAYHASAGIIRYYVAFYFFWSKSLMKF